MPRSRRLSRSPGLRFRAYSVGRAYGSQFVEVLVLREFLQSSVRTCSQHLTAKAGVIFYTMDRHRNVGGHFRTRKLGSLSRPPQPVIEDREYATCPRLKSVQHCELGPGEDRCCLPWRRGESLCENLVVAPASCIP